MDPAEKSTMKTTGDKFPADLEFIDDADVVTEPDGSTVLIKDEHPTTLKPVSTSASFSQSVRDTHNKTVDESDKKADLNETMTIERLLSMNNASNQDNQTDSIIKLLKRQAPPNPPPQVVVPPQTSQPPQQFFQQQQPITQQFFQQQQQLFPQQQQQQFIQQPLQQPILVNQMPRVSFSLLYFLNLCTET